MSYFDFDICFYNEEESMRVEATVNVTSLAYAGNYYSPPEPPECTLAPTARVSDLVSEGEAEEMPTEEALNLIGFEIDSDSIWDQINERLHDEYADYMDRNPYPDHPEY